MQECLLSTSVLPMTRCLASIELFEWAVSLHHMWSAELVPRTDSLEHKWISSGRQHSGDLRSFELSAISGGAHCSFSATTETCGARIESHHSTSNMLNGGEIIAIVFGILTLL